jgi:transglutaminase-like putative cysteine protease
MGRIRGTVALGPVNHLRRSRVTRDLMKIKIEYSTHYEYAEKVSLSPHTFRIFPSARQGITETSFVTNDGADIQYRTDLFDNPIALCLYREPSHELRATFSAVVELLDQSPFHFLLASHAVEFPFAYTPRELDRLTTYLSSGDANLLARFPHWKKDSLRSTVSALVELNEAVFDNFDYVRRQEGEARTPAVTLEMQSGACRDLAVLLAALLRAAGLASRIVSGFLCDFEDPENLHSFHAWTEVFLPGAGWVGLDPTNGIFCNQRHIKAAVGLDPDDIAPVSGSYYAPKPVAAKMSSRVLLVPEDQDETRAIDR